MTVSVVVGIIVRTKHQPDYKLATYRGIVHDMNFRPSAPP